MGCSNARLLVQTQLSETNAVTNSNTNNPVNPQRTVVVTHNEALPANIATDTNNSTTRMHLTGVDLVVERNGSYTLLLTPKTHKQLMPYVLRKKRFRILVDKSRSDETSTVNVRLTSNLTQNIERTMENNKDSTVHEKKSKKHSKDKIDSAIENVQQVATNELDKAKARFIGGRSIDRGDPEDENGNIQSDDEGMIEEIVTTVEEDKDLECKVKKKIETKKTIAQDPETHNKITKVVKTEVTEITRTITINDQHDLERAKRELGIDDVNKLLSSSSQVTYNAPSTYTTISTWVDQPRVVQVQERYYEPSNEIVTSGDFPSDSPIKQHSPVNNNAETEIKQEQTLAEATIVGRGTVAETMSTPSSQQPDTMTTTGTNDEQKRIETKPKKKKSSLNLCSCTRSATKDYDDEQRKQKAATIVEQKSKQKKKASATTTNTQVAQTVVESDGVEKSVKDMEKQGHKLITDEMKRLIKDKRSLLINYIHMKVFMPSKLFTSNDQDSKGRKVSASILDSLQHDRCSSWQNLFEKTKNEYNDQLDGNLFIQPMVKTYEELFTTKHSNVLNTFATIHNDKDIKNLPENIDYITIVQTFMNEREQPTDIGVMTKPLVEKINDTIERLQPHGYSDAKVMADESETQEISLNTKDADLSDNVKKPMSFYNEEQLTKMLGEISPHKPITLAEAIAYQYIDLDDPKLGLSNDTVQRMKNLFRPLSFDDESTLNLIRITRSGQYVTDFNLAETNPFEKFHLSQPFIYQLQQSFEPTLDLSEKQFRSLTEAILNNKEEYSSLRFDIGRSMIPPADDMKESSTNDFSQSDSGYSMTTATYESLASKVKNEFEPITEPISDQINEVDKVKSSIEFEQSIASETTEQPSIIVDKPIISLELEVPTTQSVTAEVDKLEQVLLDGTEQLTVQAESVELSTPKHDAFDIQHGTTTSLEVQPVQLEKLEIQDDKTTIAPVVTKVEESSILKPIINLHGAGVDLPEVELTKPGPLPTITITKDKSKKSKEVKTKTTPTEKVEKAPKIKKSSSGLCASCFGAKAAEKKKKESSKTAQEPIEQKKTNEQEKKDEVAVTTTIDSTPLPVLAPTKDDQITISEVEPIEVQQQSTEQVIPKVENVVVEEPHYQLPSSEPVPLISTPDPNTYDVPRSIETPIIETTENIVANVTLPEVQLPIVETVSYEEKIESVITTDIMPNVDINDSTKKGSYTLPAKKVKTKKVKEPKPPKEPKKPKEPKASKKAKEPKQPKETQETKETKESTEAKEPTETKPKAEKRSTLFAFFRHSDRKSKVPALNLPAVQLEAPQNTNFNEMSANASDPFHVPNIDLPKLDLPVPDYDRPEVHIAHVETKLSSEFVAPTVELPPIPNVNLPEYNTQATFDTNIDALKIPTMDLPELELTANENENVKLPEVRLKSAQEPSTGVSLSIHLEDDHQVEPLQTIKNEIEVEPPMNVSVVQVTEQQIPIETDQDIKIDTSIPELCKPIAEAVVTAELLSTEQKYTIVDTELRQSSEIPTITNNETVEKPEIPSEVVDFKFQIPQVELVPAVPTDINVSPPSFETDVVIDKSVVVPAVDVSTSPVKTTEKELIEPKSAIKKKSSTLALCSCFGSKSNAQKEKTKPITAHTTELPEVEMTKPSSNIASTLKTKGALRAPGNDLPAVDLPLPSVETTELPTLHTREKKRQAPKKPKSKKETATSDKAESPLEVNASVVPNVADSDIQMPSVEMKTSQEVAVQEEKIEIEPPVASSSPIETKLDEEINVQPPTAIEVPLTEEIKIQSTTAAPIEKQSMEEIKSAKVDVKKTTSSFEIRAPALDIPDLDLSAPPKSDAYKTSISLSSVKQAEVVQSRSDSGLEAIISSHLKQSSTFGTNQTIEEINQQPSISSGLGSEIIDSLTTKDITLPDLHHEPITTQTKIDEQVTKRDFTRKITMNDDIRAKLIFRQNDLKKCLETEISQSIDDFDTKKDHKALTKILTHAVDLIKDKKVTTYPELKQKLTVEHKHDAFIVDPVVRSLYVAIEEQGLDNLDKPEFPLAVRDMVRLPAIQTLEAIPQIDKDIKKEPTEIAEVQPSKRSLLSCGHSKSKPKVATIPKPPESPTTTTNNVGLLDERRRLQLSAHRTDLITTLRNHIQSSQPPIRLFPEHSKEIEKILRKTLSLVNQPKVLTYEQVRNDLKTEYKQTFYLVDPIVDIVRDTFDHCDIAQMNEKTNLDILDSNITQTANLYNHINNSTNLLTQDEYNLLKSNQLQWLNQYLVDSESKTKKLTKKNTKELSKILHRAFDIVSINVITTWEELNAQLRREHSKAHDLCDRSIELIKQAQKDGLLLLQQSPATVEQDVTAVNVISANGKRRTSSLLTDRAKQNIQNNRKKIMSSITTLLHDYNKPLYTESQIESYVNKTFHYLEEKKIGEFKTYNDLKNKLKKDMKLNHEKLIEQIVDVIEQAHATNQFDDIEKPEVQSLMRDRLDGKPLVIKEMYVSLPPRVGAFGASKHSHDDTSRYLSTSVNGDQTMNSSTSSHRIARGLSWREANERARILFYRGKHPAIHYDEQAAGFDVRMLLETTAGGTQEIPVTDSDVHELLNSCGVQWDGVNIISLVDHSEDVVRAAEQAALRVIREKGLVDLRTPPSTRNKDDNDEPLSS